MRRYDFIRISKLKDKLSRKLEEKERTLNQEISVRDIIVRPKGQSQSFGEIKGAPSLSEALPSSFRRLAPKSFFFMHSPANLLKHINPFVSPVVQLFPESESPYQEHDQLGRMVDHIDVLATIANEYQQTYYCDKNSDGTFTTKPDCLNKITRVLMNEFSLYTISALNYGQLAVLVEAVRAIAANQHNNVHLLLSSLSVRTPEFQVDAADKQWKNVVLNLSLYVECGPEPKVHVFAKGRASTVDVTYCFTTNFSQEAEPPSVGIYYPNISEYIAQQSGQSVSNNSVFTVTTEGGAQYTQAIDVCVDNATYHAKTLLIKSLGDAEAGDLRIIPKQADHVVTSNIIEITKDSLITDTAVQADPIEGHFDHMKKDAVNAESLRQIKKNKYAQMRIDKTAAGIKIENPPFGYTCTLVAAEERKLGGFTRDLRPMIAARNRAVESRMLVSQLELNPSGAKYVEFAKKHGQILSQLSTFFDFIEDLGDLEITGGLFGTQDAKFNAAAKKILIESYNRLAAIKEPFVFMEQLPEQLAELKLNTKHSVCQQKPNITRYA